MINQILEVYAPLALFVCIVGLTYKVARHLALILTRRRPRGPSPLALDPPPKKTWLVAFGQAFVHPIARFPLVSNPIWTWGISLYHVGIALTLGAYATTALVLLPHLLQGAPVPDVAQGLEASDNYSIANLMTLVFAFGEPLVANHLFGSWSDLVIQVTWIEVLFAASGNLLLILVRLYSLNGAMTHELDPSVRGRRVSGRRPPMNTVVTFIIAGIIWTEILARLEIVPHIVLIHTILGATLLLLLPFSYLMHIPYSMVALFHAASRRRSGAIA